MMKEEEGDGKDKDKNASETGKDPEEEEERGAESCRGCRERGQQHCFLLVYCCCIH